MDDLGITYQEFDFKLDGKDEFNAFYRKNRSDIYRGKEGVEFPIFFNGEKIVQGVGVIIAFLKAEELLNRFVTRSELSHGWVNGLNLNAKSSLGDEFIEVVQHLKIHGLKTQIKTDGRNVHILKKLCEKQLVDRLIFNLRGPAGLYEALTGIPLSEEELFQSLLLLEQCPEYKIILSIVPVRRSNNKIEYISPEEAGEAAAFIEEATNRKTHPFYIKASMPSAEMEVEALPSSFLFKYRTACRRYMVKTEIEK